MLYQNINLFQSPDVRTFHKSVVVKLQYRTIDYELLCYLKTFNC